MTDDDTARLRALAEAATRGKWQAEYHGVMPGPVWMYWLHETASVGVQHEPDAAHIAAASPDAILALLDALDAARRQSMDARNALDAHKRVASEWHRRMQQAEAACAAAYENKPRTGGRSLGRALANTAAYHYRSERDAAMALLRECDEVAVSLCGVADLVEHGDLFARIDAILGGDKGAA